MYGKEKQKATRRLVDSPRYVCDMTIVVATGCNSQWKIIGNSRIITR